MQTINDLESQYRDLIRRVAGCWPGLNELDNFVHVEQHKCQDPAGITILDIFDDQYPGYNSSQRYKFSSLQGADRLADVLSTAAGTQTMSGRAAPWPLYRYLRVRFP